jgi:PncC family amidohydrolase
MVFQAPRLSHQGSKGAPRTRGQNDTPSSLAARALEIAAQRDASIVTAESCTTGKLATVLSEAPGAAERLHGSFVTYTKANKSKSLGVSVDLLQCRGAVCAEVAIAMAEGALVRSPATIAVSITGVADPIRTKTEIPWVWSASPSPESTERTFMSNGAMAIWNGRRCRSAPWSTRSAHLLMLSNGMESCMPRQLIEPNRGAKRYVRRKKGKFTTKQVKVGRSLAADRRSKSKTVVKKSEGDRGDQRR